MMALAPLVEKNVRRAGGKYQLMVREA